MISHQPNNKIAMMKIALVLVLVLVGTALAVDDQGNLDPEYAVVRCGSIIKLEHAATKVGDVVGFFIFCLFLPWSSPCSLASCGGSCMAVRRLRFVVGWCAWLIRGHFKTGNGEIGRSFEELHGLWYLAASLMLRILSAKETAG